jgi:hypothetical protein
VTFRFAFFAKTSSNSISRELWGLHSSKRKRGSLTPELKFALVLRTASGVSIKWLVVLVEKRRRSEIVSGSLVASSLKKEVIKTSK